MHELLNVLYVLTQGAVLNLDHDTVRVSIEGETRLRAPLMRLGGIVVAGNVTITPFLIHRCADDGRSITWLTRTGRFKARLDGAVRGNVLLRRQQHLALSSSEWTTDLARQFVAAKIHNTRHVLMRSAREQAPGSEADLALRASADRQAGILARLKQITDIDQIRGAEGEAARSYFDVFGHMVRAEAEAFVPGGRSKRPPRDRTNALLSFLYALVRSECASACEGVGLDPQVGFLHVLRPGRPALALDLMEELRPVLADRLALTLVNRRQLKPGDFESTPGGAVSLTDEGRKAVIQAYQARKEEEVTHGILGRRIPRGLIPHIQARLLARHLRGDIAHYPPFIAH
jgi:CRISP-associated protein Cas1